MTKRIGIYPGTFDPIHNGHMSFAARAARVCGLDEVVFLPEQRPRNKQNVTDIHHRVALIRLAIAEHFNFKVVTLASNQFTVSDTLPELRALFGDAQLTLLIGSDAARTLSHWSGIATLLRQCAFAIGLRADDKPADISAIMTKLQNDYKIAIDYKCIATPYAHVASSQVRSSAADATHVHPTAVDYIREQNLYK